MAGVFLGFYEWLSLGMKRLGKPVVIELMVDWMESFLPTDEAERLVFEPGSNFFLSSAEGQSQLQISKHYNHQAKSQLNLK